MVAVTRRRSGPRRGPWLVVAVALACLCLASALPAASYSTANVGRGVSAGVVDDPNAMVGLSVAQSVTMGTTDDLVVVTNGLGSDATFTVSIRNDSTAKGDLSVNGATGDRVDFDLAAGASQQVDVAVTNDTAYADTYLYFDVRADSAGLDATVSDRKTTVSA